MVGRSFFSVGDFCAGAWNSPGIGITAAPDAARRLPADAAQLVPRPMPAGGTAAGCPLPRAGTAEDERPLPVRPTAEIRKKKY